MTAVSCAAKARVASMMCGGTVRRTEEVVDCVSRLLNGDPSCARCVCKCGGGLSELRFDVDFLRNGDRAVKETEEDGAGSRRGRDRRRHCSSGWRDVRVK